MRVYISCHAPEPAKELSALLTAAGHRVSSSWHKPETVTRPVADLDWEVAAEKNFSEIQHQTDVLVLIGGTDRYPGGKFIEAGYAAGRGKKVIVLGRVENGMLQHHYYEKAKDAAELLAMLSAPPADPAGEKSP